MIVDRRTFLAMVSAGAAGSGATGMTAQAARLETFTQWMNASRQARVAAWTPRSATSGRPIRPSTRGSRCCRSGPPATVRWPKSLSVPKTSWRRGGCPRSTARRSTRGVIGTTDAAIVRDLRQRGAVLLGKTHTTSFAYRTPAPTRNPRNLAHTPGGSSSGSAAAVAAGMVPFALGTQTMGSVLRPASYCGVTGFKASYGVLSLDGVLPFAASLDTLGFFTHTPVDMLALWEAMGRSGGVAEEFDLAVPDSVPGVEPSMAAAFQSAVAALRRGGMSIRSIDIAGMLTELHPAALDVEFYEGARFHEQRFKEYRASDSSTWARLCAKGSRCPSSATTRRGVASRRGRRRSPRSTSRLPSSWCRPPRDLRRRAWRSPATPE